MYLYEMGMDAQQVSEATGGIDTTMKGARLTGVDTTKMKGSEVVSMLKNHFGE